MDFLSFDLFWALRGGSGNLAVVTSFELAWADRVHEAVAPHGNDRAYVNLLGDREPDRVPKAWADNYARLRKLKKKWGPESVFRGNHNIPPSD